MPHGYTDDQWWWMSPQEKQNAITQEQNAQIIQQQGIANASAEERQKKAFEQQQEAIKKAQEQYNQLQGQPAPQFGEKYDAAGNLAQSTEYAKKQAADQARLAGQGISRQATTSARTAGLNPGQAAAMGSRAASDAYGQQFGQAFGQQQQAALGQYGQQFASNLSGWQANQQANQARINQMMQNLGLQMGINPGQQGTYGTQAVSPATDKFDWQSLLGAGAGLVGTLASDEKVKDGIKKESILKPVAKHVNQISYTYKGSDHPETGISAQELEKTPLKSTVIDTPQGKMVDTRRLTTANTGMIADLSRKLDKILEFYKRSA